MAYDRAQKHTGGIFTRVGIFFTVTPATRDDSGGCMQATKEYVRRLIHPDFETHGQSHPKSETEGTSGPTKWTSVREKLKK